ncbi:glycosyltransferase [Streptomyces paromomycinus]|uniref:Glycosyl transferase n=1 Tax=Streptomyces paromomycinus TaxID=92743 RepID=A0A401W7E5_STREY|nr:glycosyltransferase [Streptomyces paromomycinus]GCD45191.1 glycosyl transferase [Streptomyces paromomycinus]
MKILVTAAGSYGDVAPYTGLGARLQEAGHTVALAADASYASLVRAAGLEFRALPADPRRARGGAPGGQRELMRRAAAFVRELGPGIADAAAQGADLLLLSATTAPLGRHAAEAMGIASLDLPLQPNAPTGDFPPVVAGTRSLGRWGNRAAGRLSLRVVDRLYADGVRELRARLGLPPVPAGALRRRRNADRRTVLHGVSPALVPRPTDWRPGLELVGNWWPYTAPDAALPPALEDFLAAGPPPVFVGFGSMGAGARDDGTAARLTANVVAALRRARVRGVIQSGWAGLAGPEGGGGTEGGPGPGAGDDILTVGEVPHALLFPRTAAVVHHAGAGTTAAALRAGVPAVPVPVAADQPFWAARLGAVGAGTGPVPFRALTEEEGAPGLLAEAVARAVREPAYRAAAAGIGRRLEAEDGAGAVLKAVEDRG